MKVALFGATGLLGWSVGQAVLRRRYNLVSFSGNGSDELKGIGRVTPLSITDDQNLTRTLLDEWPDAIINCSAISSPDAVNESPRKSHAINVVATTRLAEIAAHLGARFLHVSTDMVFDGTQSPYRSTDLPNPLTEYGRQKLEAEKSVLATTDDNLIVLRVTLLNGNSPSGQRSPHERILNGLATGSPPLLFDDEIRQPSSAGNVAEAMVELLERSNLNGLFHWAGSEEVSRYELGIRILDRFGFSSNHLKRGSRKEAPAEIANRPAHLTFELNPLVGKLKTRPADLEEQLAELTIPAQLYGWYRENADDPTRYVARF
ncbi:MAG: NAD(P)-dependent oxidoreductase [Opitutae bacterium]|nr:NAD(P)-dependent oxidoreductase [Opitutae bacterium]